MSIFTALTGRPRTVDTAWEIAENIHRDLSRLRELQEEQAESQPKHSMAHKNASGQNGGGAAATVDIPLGTVPPDAEWVIQRIAATGPANGEIAVYFDTPGDATQLKEEFTLNANGRYADAVSNNLYAPENRQLYARAFAVPAGGTVTISLQVLQKPGKSHEEATLSS